MKKDFTDIESLLKSGQREQLSPTEKTEMFSVLAAYTDFYTPADTAPQQSTPLWRRFGYSQLLTGALALFLVISGGVGATATNSLPGQFLYPIKTEVIEPLVGYRHVSELNQLEYQVSLFENRLYETKELARTQALTPKTMEIVTSYTDQNIQEITELINQTDASGETLSAVSQAVAIAKAHEHIEDQAITDSPEHATDALLAEIQQVYSRELADLNANNSNEITTYIEAALTDIDSAIALNGTTSASIQNELADYLADITTAIENSNLDIALQYTTEADQLVEFTEYIADEEEL